MRVGASKAKWGTVVATAILLLGAAEAQGAVPSPSADQSKSQAAESSRARVVRPPNIVLIMADDVGVEAFKAYGGQSYATPELDRLIAGGMRFDHCHSQPLCTPSRVKLMTGRSNARNYVAFSVLRKDARTFAHALRDRGYATGVFGKWQLLAAEHYKKPIRGSGTLPEDAGFDTHVLWQVDKLGSRYWGPLLRHDGETKQHPPERFGPDVFCDALCEFMERSSRGENKKPFFAYWPMALVHSPFVPAPDEHGKRPEGKNGPAQFGSMMHHMDRLIGRVARKIEALGIESETLFLFTSDNGTHRRIRSQSGGKTIRGGKGLTNDRGTHVPLVAWWKGIIEKGSTCKALIDFADFYPTLLELAGAKREAQLEGRSFAAALAGEKLPPRDGIACYYWPRPKTRKKSSAKRFARDRRYKLYADGRLFDVVADPEEQSALASDKDDDALRDARARLGRVLAKIRANPKNSRKAPDERKQPSRVTLSGAVYRADGKPWEGATVELTHRPYPSLVLPTSSVDIISTKTDERGRFRVKVLDGQAYGAWAWQREGSRYRCTDVVERVVAGKPPRLTETKAGPRWSRRARVEGLEAWKKYGPFKFALVDRGYKPTLRKTLTLGEDGSVDLPPLPGRYAELEIRAANDREIFTRLVPRNEAQMLIRLRLVAKNRANPKEALAWLQATEVVTVPPPYPDRLALRRRQDQGADRRSAHRHSGRTHGPRHRGDD